MPSVIYLTYNEGPKLCVSFVLYIDYFPLPISDTKPSAVYPVYNGGAKLDTDTINYIHRIYCRECRMEEQRRQNADDPAPRPASVAEGLLRHPPVRTTSATGPTSPQVEEVSLQQNKDKNKECESHFIEGNEYWKIYKFYFQIILLQDSWTHSVEQLYQLQLLSMLLSVASSST